MGYHLEGRLLEVRSCNVPYSCRIGDDPYRGSCDTIIAWHVEKGQGRRRRRRRQHDCLGYVIAHWRGKAQARQAFALGAHDGLFCAGCCWALMLLMFAAGAGRLGWMLLLAAIMAIEKNLPWGRRLSTPLGVALLAWAAWLVATHA